MLNRILGYNTSEMNIDYKNTSDEELVKLYVAGDTLALQELFNRYEKMVFNTAYRMLMNRNEAMDIVQDVFVLVLRKASTFKGESKFTTWLYRVTINCCKDMQRKRKRDISIDEPTEEGYQPLEDTLKSKETPPPEIAESAELQRTVREAIFSLPPKFKEIIILYDIEGLSYQEISDVLGIKMGTVKSRLNRARASLADALEPYREQLI